MDIFVALIQQGFSILYRDFSRQVSFCSSNLSAKEKLSETRFLASL